ncbi:MAG: hypothetical protein QXQ90_06820 [Desulfurococcaceae archaeon]
MIKCPFCGFESSLEDFKKLREPWRFRFYDVKMLECPKCKGVFNYYEGLHQEVSVPHPRSRCDQGIRT